MSRSSNHFEPAVTVSALALNNLKQLPYYLYRLSTDPSATSSLAKRAKWLEHGVGSHTAFHAAALAELSEKVPAVLAVSIPQQSTPSSPPKPPRRPTSASTSTTATITTTTNSNANTNTNLISNTPQLAPTLWLFAPTHVLRRAHEILATDFKFVDQAIWSPTGSPIVTRALTFALRRAIASAMHSENALRVGDDILHPHTSLAYTFNIGLGNGPDPNILIHVSARHHPVRYINDNDCAAALVPHHPPISVFTAPLGLKGVLAPRPCAGDALSVSVLKRWREAGLLPKDMSDSTVIFLKLDDGVEVPFPRACVLTVEKKTDTPKTPSPTTLDDLEIPDFTLKKSCKTNVALWKSRKRPRSPMSPSTTEETDLTAFAINNDNNNNNNNNSNNINVNNNEIVPEPVVLDTEEVTDGDDVPTAQTISAALEATQAKGNEEHVAKLNHPLIEPIAQVTFHEAPEVSESNDGTPENLDGSVNATVTQNPIEPTPNDGQAGVSSSKLEPLQSSGVLGSTTTSKNDEQQEQQEQQQQEQQQQQQEQQQQLADQSSNGLDAFLMGGPDNDNPQESVGPPESSGGIEMSEFVGFDDDATVMELFGNNMDNGDKPLFQSEDTARSSAYPQDDGLLKRESFGTDLLDVNQNLSGPKFEINMDVDSANQQQVIPVHESEKKEPEIVVPPPQSTEQQQQQQQQPQSQSQSQSQSQQPQTQQPQTQQQPEQIQQHETLNVMDSTLASFRSIMPNTKASHDLVKAKLSSLYEEDLLQRRTASLKATRAISKRKKKMYTPRHIFVTKTALSSPSPSRRNIAVRMLRDSSSPQLPSPKHLLPTAEQRFSDHLRSMYVPRRPLRKYINMYRKGMSVSLARLNEGGYESSDDEEEEKESGDNIHKANSTQQQPQQQQVGAGSRPQSGTNANMQSAIPDIKASITARTSAINKNGICVDYDPAKIVDSVAVDCASVCMVLAAERASHASISSTSTENSSSVSGGDTNSSCPSSGRDLDNINNNNNKTLSTTSSTSNASIPSASQSVARTGITSVLPKAPVAASLAGSSSATRKKEREFLSLLSLIEMQIFGVSDLGLFSGTEMPRPSDSSQSRVADGKAPVFDRQPDSVSQATMRRLLLGLRRTLEMSDTFKTWIEAFRDSDKNVPIPSVQGPLSVNAFLGRSATAFPLPPPRVCIGRNEEWIETSGAVLPLWEKTGLEPYSEAKHVEYIALGPKDIEEDVRVFLRDLSSAYEECLFGRHKAIPDTFTPIANSMPKTGAGKSRNGSTLLDYEKSMADQYQLTTTTLVTKLTAFAKEKRKNPSGYPTNIVAYVISPFNKNRTAANVALIHAVAPLVGTIQGTVPSLSSSHATSGLNLPVAPWRSSPSSKSTISITVRLIPREVVDRRFSGPINVDQLLDRPPRPQLMKAISFAVFSSIRYKRVRTPPTDAEMGNALARGAILPDDLMSPMTPEVMGDAAGGPCGTPVSPLGVSSTTDESGGYNTVNVPGGGGHVDQSGVLSPSYLHEGAIVLAGVGRHVGQTNDKANMVLHLGYAYCESLSRFIFAWTDQRGELLDTATVPVSKSCLSASRRKAFWGMWARGQRWRLPYVEDVHATVCKLGVMSRDELEDWDWVMNKVVCSSYGGSERKNADGSERRVARRFPPIQGPKGGDDINDVYIDVPTPATPGIGQSSSISSSGRNSAISMDVKLPGIGSVSVLSIYEADTHLLMEKPSEFELMDRRDFAIVSTVSLNEAVNSNNNNNNDNNNSNNNININININNNNRNNNNKNSNNNHNNHNNSNNINSNSNNKNVNHHQHLKAQANVILGRFINDKDNNGGIAAMEMSVLRHYGSVGAAAEDNMSDDRCGWDSFDIEQIANTIAVNFHELRYVASAPCWPPRRWLSMLPVHLEAVRTIDANLINVYSFGGCSSNVISVR